VKATDIDTAIPLLDLHRQYDEIRGEVLAAITRVCDSQGFILGPEVEALEREICSFTGAAGAAGCSSGTEALWLALVAAGVEPGDAVISTPFSFFASASAIVRAGATPILIDVDASTLNLDAALVEQWLREHSGGRSSAPAAAATGSGGNSDRSNTPARRPGKVSAILPVHLYGQCADMDAFARIGQEFDVAIVEDAAQAIGASWRGQAAGSLGATAAFSFYPTLASRPARAQRQPNACDDCAITAARAATIMTSSAGTAAWTPFRPRCCA
jgi:dTDP-4-amino-4,6-dideoxygalactose transaminase